MSKGYRGFKRLDGEANGGEEKRGEVEQRYRFARGSIIESATHLDALSSLKVISDDDYNTEEKRLARIAAMRTNLLRRPGRKAHAEHRAKRQTAAQPGSAPRPALPGRRRNPGTHPPLRTSNPRVSGVSASPKGAAEIDPPRSEVTAGAKRPADIETRAAGPRGREAPAGDRTTSLDRTHP